MDGNRYHCFFTMHSFGIYIAYSLEQSLNHSRYFSVKDTRILSCSTLLKFVCIVTKLKCGGACFVKARVIRTRRGVMDCAASALLLLSGYNEVSPVRQLPSHRPHQ
jgi:hypothetical protein